MASTALLAIYLNDHLGESVDGIGFARLAERAERQRAQVEELHRTAAARAFASAMAAKRVAAFCPPAQG